jgi:parvulin-like peptidyl-prolyl isomerase
MLTWFRKKTKTIMIVVAVVFAGTMFYGLGYRGLKGEGGGAGSKVLAKVNGREIDPMRYQELVNRLAQNYGGKLAPSDMAMINIMALGQAIDFTLMQEEADKRVRVSGSEIDAALNNIMQQQKIPSRRDLENVLKQQGLSLGKFRDFIKGDIEVQKLQMKLMEEVKVTPDDLREVRASHILVKTEAEAKDLLQQINKGADFASLAKKYSQDPGSAAKGGDLGYFSTGSMVEAFEKTAFSLKPGEVSGLIQTPFGYHILKVTDSRLRKFPGAKGEIEQAALREKQEKTFRRWYSDVRSKAKVEIINPVMKGHDLRFKGHVQEAIDQYQKAALQEPTNPLIHIFLGDSYLSLGRKDLAISEYENAEKVEGGNPELYLVLGQVYAKMGERSLAADQFHKASLIAGDNKDAHEKLLKIFEKLKRPSEAAKEKTELKRIEKREKFVKELTK